MNSIILSALIMATGCAMSGGDNLANTKLFNVVKAFYVNLCQRDYKNENRIRVFMYSCGEDYIFVRLNMYMNLLETRAFHYIVQKEKGVEINVNSAKAWEITFSNAPQKIRLNETEFLLVDKFDIGPELIVLNRNQVE